jgi:hypothetical protein
VHPVTVAPHGDVATKLNRMAATDPEGFAKVDLRLAQDRMAHGEYSSLERTQKGMASYPPAPAAVTQRQVWDEIRQNGLDDGAPSGAGAVPPSPDEAQVEHLANVATIPEALRGTDAIKSTVREMLRRDWTPDQIQNQLYEAYARRSLGQSRENLGGASPEPDPHPDATGAVSMLHSIAMPQDGGLFAQDRKDALDEAKRTGGDPAQILRALRGQPPLLPAEPERPGDFTIGFGKSGRRVPMSQKPGRTFFFGGAGNDDTQPYKLDFVRRLIESGIKNARAVPQNATSKNPPYGFVLDVASIPGSNNKFSDGVYLQTPGVAPGPSGQYNLIGYSFGAVAAAQQAYADAKLGKVVDNLVLIGAPINADLKAALEASGNIRRILYIDIKGDPIRAGNSDLNYIYNLRTVKRQMDSGEGHFYFAKQGAQGVVRRSTLARQLYALGVR